MDLAEKLLVTLIIIISVINSFSVVIGLNYQGRVESYLACGCGCCDNTKIIDICLYHDGGDNINFIIQKDLRIRMSINCFPLRCSNYAYNYTYCD